MSDTIKWGSAPTEDWGYPVPEGSSHYDAAFVATTTLGFAPILLSLVGIRHGEHVLDVACGTGAVTHAAADIVGQAGRVVGVDLSPGMLAVAQHKTVHLDDAAEIEWIEGDASSLPFDDESFDVVVSQLGLQYFSDRLSALREMRRVLKPDGRVGVMVWGGIEQCPGQTVMREIWTRDFGSEKGTIFALQHSLSNPEDVRSLLVDAGFHDILVEPTMGSAHYASPEMLTRAYGTGLEISADDDTRHRIFDEVRQALEQYIGEDGITCPMEALVGRARR